MELRLEEAPAQQILRVRDHRVARMFLREVAHGFFGQRVVLALDIADAEIELVPRRCRRRQGGERPGRIGIARRRGRQGSRRIAGTGGIGKIERLASASSAGSADGRFGWYRQLTAAPGPRGARGAPGLVWVEG